MAEVTAPSFDTLHHVMDTVRAFVSIADACQDGTEIEEPDPVTPAEREMFEQVSAWVVALENLDAESEIAMATAVLAKHGLIAHPKPIGESLWVLVMSTAHITQETADWLTELAHNNTTFVTHISGGWLVDCQFTHATLATQHPDLSQILAHVVKLGVDMVRFDCDAHEIEELPTYEW